MSKVPYALLMMCIRRVRVPIMAAACRSTPPAAAPAAGVNHAASLTASWNGLTDHSDLDLRARICVRLVEIDIRNEWPSSWEGLPFIPPFHQQQRLSGQHRKSKPPDLGPVNGGSLARLGAGGVAPSSPQAVAACQTGQRGGVFHAGSCGSA